MIFSEAKPLPSHQASAPTIEGPRPGYHLQFSLLMVAYTNDTSASSRLLAVSVLESFRLLLLLLLLDELVDAGRAARQQHGVQTGCSGGKDAEAVERELARVVL